VGRRELLKVMMLILKKKEAGLACFSTKSLRGILHFVQNDKGMGRMTRGRQNDMGKGRMTGKRQNDRGVRQNN